MAYQGNQEDDEPKIERPVITDADVQEAGEGLGSNPFTVSESFDKLDTGEAPSIFSSRATGAETVFGKTREQGPIKPSRRLPNVPKNHCIMCGEKIVGRYVSIRDNCIHNDCFTCAVCNMKLKGKGHFEANRDFYCRTHNPVNLR
ncbi:PDZ and LIM domain protein 3 [Holothuria leucospilota]|uniref:PDZ and LIM domain protein 3 n=1 Tax=Holothuria leucospilota TaxID=206669 RepID=A0A9Q1CAW4_HOLLE|nr:PDZ and LIM domain protein 3 [Holothuria leucospilota]